MINFSEISKGVKILIDGKPYEVLEAKHLKKAQRRPVLQTRLRNIITGEIINYTAHQGEAFEEPDIEKLDATFLYAHREKYFFCLTQDKSKRFEFAKEQLGQKANFLKPNLEVEALSFEGEIVNISLPIKMNFKVIEAPPGIKGDTAQGGVKPATLETGYQLNVPLFVDAGDIVEINTETGEYVRRIQEIQE